MSNKISAKHGLNPTIGVCFWCGEETGEIALLGKLKDDAEASRYSIISMEPCDKCADRMKQGIAVMEVAHTPCMPNQPAVTENARGTWYFTRRYVVVKADSPWAKEMGYKAGQRTVMPTEDFAYSFDDVEEASGPWFESMEEQNGN